MKCSICKKDIKKNHLTGWSSGNNAEPINHGRCCDECNARKVIPARFLEVINNEIKSKKHKGSRTDRF